jgi:hypothetical protein
MQKSYDFIAYFLHTKKTEGYFLNIQGRASNKMRKLLMAVIGAGLIGLAGFRRKNKR